MAAQSYLKNCVPALMNWYADHARPLPWREDHSGYRVWISEIMLQQTRIETVIPYYYAFLEKMPTLRALAEAPTETLMKCWEGLGYYSRARNLQKAARQVIESGREELPTTYDELIKLPGIGPYTAGAIASIAFHERVPAVDGNVMRVLARLSASYTDLLSAAAKKEFFALASELVPEEDPGRFNEAVMELGETVCLPNTVPHCEICPLNETCRAHALGIADQLPVRSGQKARKIERKTVCVLITAEDRPQILLHKRPDAGLLAGLYEFPNFPGTLTEEQVCKQLTDLGLSVKELQPTPGARHIFSHIEWQMSGYRGSVSGKNLPDGYLWVTREQMREQYALPSAFRAFLPFTDHISQEEG